MAVVERQWVGGSCPAVACLPSKNEIWNARVAHLARHAADFGAITGPVAIDMAKVRERKRGMVEREAAFHMQAYESSGAELIMGVGRFVAPKTIEVQLNDGGTRTLSGSQVVVNVGTHAAIPDVPGLAIGEVAGSPQFTHVSVDDFRIVRDNLAGGNRSTGDRLIPYTLFTDPPLARVGLSESDAQRQGVSVRVATLPMNNVLRTEATDETQGFMKVLVSANDDRILGFTMIGSEAGEVMAAMQTAMLRAFPIRNCATP